MVAPAISARNLGTLTYRPPIIADTSLRPVIPDRLDLTDRTHIEDLPKRVNLRRLFPHVKGNPPQVWCPWHEDRNHPSLGVFANNIYCFTCNRSAGALEAIRLLCAPTSTAHLYAIARALLGAEREEEPVVEMSPMDKIVLEQYRRGLKLHTERRDWLTAKYGLKPDAQDALDIGYFAKAFTFPVYNLAGELLNIRFRRDPDQWRDPDPAHPLPRYWGISGRNQALWYLPPTLRGTTIADAVMDAYHKRALVWTEGEMDAAALWSIGVPALSTTNGAGAFKHGSLHLTDLAGCKVYVMFDADAAGQTASAELVETLKGLDIEAVQVTLPAQAAKDAAELVARGWTRHDFAALLKGGRS